MDQRPGLSFRFPENFPEDDPSGLPQTQQAGTDPRGAPGVGKMWGLTFIPSHSEPLHETAENPIDSAVSCLSVPICFTFLDSSQTH